MASDPGLVTRKRWRVGFYVTVDVEAYEGEAAVVAAHALAWPGELFPYAPPVTVTGELNHRPVSATIHHATPLMEKEL